jgi:hypothetical protein
MNYEALRDGTVTVLIQKYGKPCYTVTTLPATGWRKVFNPGEGRMEWVDGSGNVVTTEPSPRVSQTTGVCVEKRYTIQEVNGTTILQGDRRFMVSPALTPTVGGFLYVEGVQLKIINVVKMSPGLVNLVWEVQCRE